MNTHTKAKYDGFTRETNYFELPTPKSFTAVKTNHSYEENS